MIDEVSGMMGTAGAGTGASMALAGRAIGTGACGRCAAEIAQGSRPQGQQCYAFSGAFEGASVCQTCGHSWHDHG